MKAPFLAALAALLLVAVVRKEPEPAWSAPSARTSARPTAPEPSQAATLGASPEERAADRDATTRE